jgi:hypothetical protein
MPRTLDAFQHVISKFERNRIEKICGVLVSRDYAIVSKLKSSLRSDQEAQIVVPFTYDELLNKDDPRFFTNRFNEYFSERDLFDFREPLKKDLFFFGMSELVSKIIHQHQSGENSALFGLRRTGKTSVTYAIQRTLSAQDDLVIRIDCQNPAFHNRSWNYALWFIIQEMSKEFKYEGNLVSENAYTSIDASIHFEREMKEIVNNAKKNQLLIIFDEIERITFTISNSEGWKSGQDFIPFWQTLRSIFQKPDSVFTCLLVGTNSLSIEKPTINGFDNPIYNQISPHYMPPFSVDQTREMISTLGGIMGYQFQPELFTYLTDDFGGHPFLIRQMASLITKTADKISRPISIDKSNYKIARSDFIRNHANYIEMILNVLQEFYKDEYTMLTYLASGDSSTFEYFAENEADYINHIKGYGLIVQYSNAEWAFRVEIIRDYLRTKQKYTSLNLTKDQMLSEISERRNDIEPKLRKLIRTQLGSRYGKNEAKIKFIAILDQKQKNAANALSYDQLFDGTSFQLYFDDLRKVIRKYWEDFTNILGGDITKFDQRMSSINMLRVDAHANDISEEQFYLFRTQIKILEEQINQYI